MRHAHPAAAIAALLLALSPAPAAAQRALPEIRINDNRASAGHPTATGVEIALEVRPGLWRPREPEGPALPVLAFAERGQSARNPGPLIRVRAGQTIDATVHNRSDSALVVFGLGDRATGLDSFPLPAGASRTVRFRAPPPGTYYYAAVFRGQRLLLRYQGDSQLNGLIVVDPPEGPTHPEERFFVISWWFQDPDTIRVPAVPAMGTMVINGLTWPHTERFEVATGDTLRWRWVNLTEAPHPMHLHGFYFTVGAHGDGVRDTLYAPEGERQAVTERVGPFETLALRWSPERPGNWIFHCHFAFHVSHNVSLTPMRDFSDVRPTGDHVHGMGGLVLGIHARQRGPRLLAASLPAVRPIRLLIRSQPRVYGEQPGYGYVLGGSPEESAEGPPPVPGPTLVLERGVPVAVSLVNQTHEPAAVHWHGIELDSYPDGVPGWSGEAGHVLPSIPPGDSLTVRFTPPRAGTFMYHSHFNELQQIASGLYGALLVVPPGGAADAERDRVLLFSLGGVPTDSAKVLLNGAWPPRPLELRGGVTQRLRLINIMANGGLQVALLRGDSLIRWTPVAKDGAELPAAQRGGRPSRVRILAGETYDFEVTPGAGDLVLRYVRVDRPPVLVPVRVTPMMAQASPP